MIVIDRLALVAIFEREPDAEIYANANAIERADRRLISAVNVHEIGLVMRIRRGMPAANRVWRSLQIENDFEIIPFDEVQARGALSAFDRYGRGVNPKTRLNLADCAAYALAKSRNAPLLFKGDDFRETDLEFCL